MSDAFEIFLIVLLILILVFILYRVLTKNKKMIFKGHDDFVYSALVLVIILAINPVSENMSYYGILRSLILILVVFAQFGIKRGISPLGFEKVCFTLPWNKIEDVFIQSLATSVSKIVITIRMKNKLRFKLYFRINLLPEIVNFLETKLPEVKVENELIKKYNQLSRNLK